MKIKFAVLCVMLLVLGAIRLDAQTAAPKESESFKKAKSYFFQQKYDMAEFYLQEELKNNPENGTAYSYLGDIFLRNKQYDGAIQLYKKALEVSGPDANNFFNLGEVYYYKQMGDMAIDYFRKSIAADPNLKFAYYWIGLTYLKIQRDKQNTILNWESYLRIAPEDPQYEKIRRVIELLKDPNFQIPPQGSEISIEEALHLGGAVLQKGEIKNVDKTAGDEGKKNVNKTEDIYRDDVLP